MVSPLSIITFIGVILLIFSRPLLQIPYTTKRFQIDYGTAPLLGVIFLVGTMTITPNAVVNGIIGDSVIQPYTILILFMSLAYICLSLDATGLFDYIALRTAKAAGTSGKKLFFYFFALSSLLTLFTSNDIVILTLTPIIYYFAKSTKTNPVPFLIAQFFAANIWSAALYTGNPTNIIVAQANNYTFFGYLQWMLLPTVAAGLVCLGLLWLVFRKKVPQVIEAPKVDAVSALRDRQGAIFGTASLAAALVGISVCSVFSVPVWQFPLGFCLIVAARDLARHVRNGKNLPAHNSALVQSLRRMPWKIVPFVIGLFVMVESLIAAGYLDAAASFLSSNLSGPLSSTFGVGLSSSTVANLVSNQPMTILFTRLLQNPSYVASSSSAQAGVLSLVLSSNFAANITLIGSLAGLMWSKLLKDKDVNISFREFSKYGLLIMPLTLISAYIILFLQIAIQA